MLSVVGDPKHNNPDYRYISCPYQAASSVNYPPQLAPAYTQCAKKRRLQSEDLSFPIYEESSLQNGCNHPNLTNSIGAPRCPVRFWFFWRGQPFMRKAPAAPASSVLPSGYFGLSDDPGPSHAHIMGRQRSDLRGPVPYGYGRRKYRSCWKGTISLPLPSASLSGQPYTAAYP